MSLGHSGVPWIALPSLGAPVPEGGAGLGGAGSSIHHDIGVAADNARVRDQKADSRSITKARENVGETVVDGWQRGFRVPPTCTRLASPPPPQLDAVLARGSKDPAYAKYKDASYLIALVDPAMKVVELRAGGPLHEELEVMIKGGVVAGPAAPAYKDRVTKLRKRVKRGLGARVCSASPPAVCGHVVVCWCCWPLSLSPLEGLPARDGFC